MARIPALSLLVIALAACSSTPPAPPAATSATSAASAAAPAQAQAQPQPQPNAVDPAVIQALNDMGKYLQSLRQFEVFIDLSGERVLQGRPEAAAHRHGGPGCAAAGPAARADAQRALAARPDL